MRALDQKLLRELVRLKGQIATIALVIASGIASYIMLHGTYQSLEQSRAAYYDRFRFAHVFATLERAPESLSRRIETVPGVSFAETRISKEAMLPIEGLLRPAYGRVLSLPGEREPATNAIRLERGRLPERARADEVVLLESFAAAHGLNPGDHLPAVINARLRDLRIVGIARSPEFVYALHPGATIADPKRSAVLWMDRAALAAMFDLGASFNEVSLRLERGASEAAVVAALDRILRPYGGDGAIVRKNQVSNRILTGELDQLGTLAGMVPIVFLGAAMFLIRLVLGRLISLQRTEIAILKALGYSHWAVGKHFLGLVLVVLLPGSLLGVFAGFGLGKLVLGLYEPIFQFPDLEFRLSATTIATSLVASVVAALAGAFLAVRAAVKLPPAEAMRPPAPARYRRGFLERLGIAALLGPNGMMVFREIQRRPLKTAMSVLGISGAVSLVILGRFGLDSVEDYLEDSLRRSYRQDLAVMFTQPLPERAIGEIARMPSVLSAEGLRAVPARARNEHHSRDIVLIALPERVTLRQLIDKNGRKVSVPSDAVVITKTLGQILGVRVGEHLELELREGERHTVRPIIGAVIDEATGLQVYARTQLLSRLEGDVSAVSAVLINVAGEDLVKVVGQLRRSPHVMTISDLGEDIARERVQHASAFNVWTSVAVLMAGAVIFGVVYNNARISLTARARELASLRVLGFTRREISFVLLAGLAIETTLALPIGLLLGRAWARQFMSNIDQEMFRWVPIVSFQTYALAVAVTLVSAAASAFWVRRSLDHLDLVSVLKSRE